MHGIHTSKSDYWVHLHPIAKRIYCYLVSDMKKFLTGTDLPVIGGKSRNGVTTGWGYLVSKGAPIVRGKDVPAKYLSHIDWRNLTNRESGLIHGEQIVLDLLTEFVIFPTASRPFWFATEEEKQFSGIDIENNEISIDVKTETVFPTKNLFVQTDECGHAVNLKPDGSVKLVEVPDLHRPLS